MLPRWSRIWALLYLVICLNTVAAGRLGPARRQDTSPTSTVASSKTEENSQVTATTAATTTPLPSNSRDTSSSSGVSTSINVASSATATPIPSAINGNSLDNTTTIFNSTTVPAGELPLDPRLTPGWAVAGVILLISGAVYAVIGIKNTWLHTFLSTAYLSAVCTTILIVYVMVSPVSDGVQGAYVVAVICTGLILGGGATVFKEITESIACLLGGFCFSMWLLTLREGGLLTNTGGKIVFIAAFTLGSFAFYFSHYTRIYALIASISFAGATVTVLGIDCFSRAGLKEFWVYIWALNENLFPLGADTYPLTKGIRVEIALVILIFLVGVISQVKMWKLIQEHRAKRAAAHAEAQRELDVEEAQVGQQVEEHAARERRQWEATYGDNSPGSPTGSGDSGVADLNEKKSPYNQASGKEVSTREDVIELAELPASNSPAPSTAPPKHATDGLQEEAAHEDGGDVQESEQKVWVVGSDGEARPASWASAPNSQRLSRSTAPEVIPLPFQIPKRNERDDDDRSSVATYADEDDRSVIMDHRASRASLGNRLSVGSANLIRSLSQRSAKSKKKAGEMSPPPRSSAESESQEDLVARVRKTDLDTGSTAATVDGMSSDDDEETVTDGSPSRTMEITANLADRPHNGDLKTEERTAEQPKSLSTEKQLDLRPYSMAETVATDILDSSVLGDQTETKLERSSSTNPVANENRQPTSNGLSEDKSDSPKGGSVTPSTASIPASLTKDRLPAGLSRVASAYRTNEWAKHLSQAEVPEPGTLPVVDDGVQEGDAEDTETVAPVNVESLQETAQNATPAPLKRSPSSLSIQSPAAGPSRSNSRISMTPSMTPTSNKNGLTSSTTQVQDPNVDIIPVGLTHPNPLHTKHSFQKARRQSRRISADVIAHPIAEEHVNDHVNPSSEDGNASGQPSPVSSEFQQSYIRPPVPGVVSYSSPQTLLGKREMLLRNKSSVGPAIRDSRTYSPQPPGSDAGSIHNLPMYGPALGQDADDIPLNHRKQLMRQSSLMSVGNPSSSRLHSNLAMAPVPGHTLSGAVTADAVPFDSHRPQQRRSTLPSQIAREAQLASFRESVAQDLLAGTSVLPTPTNSGRETPLMSVSSTSLLQGLGSGVGMISSSNRSGDVRRSMEASRNLLLSQREQEMQRREMEKWEKERTDRAFEEHMRSGLLIDAHRDAMRKMQSAARDG